MISYNLYLGGGQCELSSKSSKGLTVPTVPNNSGFFLVDLILRHRNVISDIQNVKAIVPKTMPIELRSSRTSMIFNFHSIFLT